MFIADLQESLRQHVLATIKSRQITQCALAEMIGMRQAHISNFVRGRRGFSIDGMDSILKALGLNARQLIAMTEQTRVRKASSSAIESVALIHLRAAMRPIFAEDEVQGEIGFTKALLRRVKAVAPDARKLWVRFAAVKADKRLSAPMNPRIENGSVLLIDRHYCSLVAYRKAEPNLYLIRKGDSLMVRRIEVQGRQLWLRPENVAYPLESINVEPKKPLESCIVGRVAHVATEI
jgi:SOS-response transcriptional repressor LexA